MLRRLSGAYSLMGRARLDDNSQHDTGFFPIDDGPHFVELDWRRASGPDANDRSFELWIDGASVHAATALDNSVSSVDFVKRQAHRLSATNEAHAGSILRSEQTISGGRPPRPRKQLFALVEAHRVG